MYEKKMHEYQRLYAAKGNKNRGKLYKKTRPKDTQKREKLLKECESLKKKLDRTRGRSPFANCRVKRTIFTLKSGKKCIITPEKSTYFL